MYIIRRRISRFDASAILMRKSSLVPPSLDIAGIGQWRQGSGVVKIDGQWRVEIELLSLLECHPPQVWIFGHWTDETVLESCSISTAPSSPIIGGSVRVAGLTTSSHSSSSSNSSHEDLAGDSKTRKVASIAVVFITLARPATMTVTMIDGLASVTVLRTRVTPEVSAGKTAIRPDKQGTLLTRIGVLPPKPCSDTLSSSTLPFCTSCTC